MQDSKRLVIWYDSISYESGAKVLDKVFALHSEKPDETIDLLINSGGGNPDVAVAFYEIVRNMGIRLHTYGVGTVSSAAVIVLLSGEKRFVSPYITMLVHEMGYSNPNQQRLTQLEATTRSTLLTQQHYKEIVCARTNLVQGKEFDQMVLGSTVLDASQIIEHGFAHELWLPKEGGKAAV